MLSKSVYFTSADMNGCGWYRTKLIADFFKQDHHWMFPAYREEDGALTIRDEKIFSNEVILVQRQSHPFFTEALSWLRAAHNKKIVYDIDDNLWRIPCTNPAQAFYPKRELKNIESILKCVDYMTVSTEPLRDFFLRNGMHDKIEVVPNMLPSLFPKRIIENKKVRIGYCGSPTHKGDFNHYLVNGLRDLKKKYDIELYFFGYNPMKGAEDYFCEGTPVDQYLPAIYNLDLDIALAPLANDEFNRCKSNLKFLEYSSCGFVTVANDVYPYSTTIINGETGILIGKDKEWKSTIEDLIVNKEKRQTLASNAYDFVNQNFTYQNNGQLVVDKWEKVIGDLYDIH